MNEPLSSVHNPRIKRAQKLRDRRRREREQAFLIEGYRELKRASESALPMEELFICPELYLGVNEPALVDDRAGTAEPAIGRTRKRDPVATRDLRCGPERSGSGGSRRLDGIRVSIGSRHPARGPPQQHR